MIIGIICFLIDCLGFRVWSLVTAIVCAWMHEVWCCQMDEGWILLEAGVLGKQSPAETLYVQWPRSQMHSCMHWARNKTWNFNSIVYSSAVYYAVCQPWIPIHCCFFIVCRCPWYEVNSRIWYVPSMMVNSSDVVRSPIVNPDFALLGIGLNWRSCGITEMFVK